MKFAKHLTRVLAVSVLGLACALPAQAQQKVRLAFVRTITLLPFYHAQQAGYFKSEGLDVEMVAVQGGPAAASAVASGSAEIGYAALTPVMIARDRKQPFRFIMGLEWEQLPKVQTSAFLASERSGVKSFADLKGKTILAGPPGGLCELGWREWLSKNNIAWDQVKVLTTPFPQQQAALELGNADATCTFDPFLGSIKASKVNPVTLGHGYLANDSRRYFSDGLFASEAWIAANGATIAAFKRAVSKAVRDLTKDPAPMRKILSDEYKLAPALADGIKFNIEPDRPTTVTDFAPVVDALKRHGMVSPSLGVSDVVFESK